ncbi:diaminopimelate decarboxylase [Aerococcus sp. 1KP-2016]|uniref:diaminopimelate decarboxylase n=1 Tax=Aerococcus sp. 1KP-2016 TaxID=1981982 RepID=UPI000B982480|nr:diaminopimelate decarboxylase [Aerococcus sp. 1KP-2016]OYQ66339.1 diaminopimelate decarboxylase [Aerococcus sp. 1KP-2016]
MQTKRPFTTLAKVEEIAAEIPTPFHLYDEAGIRDRCRRLKKAFSWNPNFQEYFAVKATPTPQILKIMQEEGMGVDCATYTELLLAEKVGFSGHDIMFSSNVTPAIDFQKAAELGAIINFDDISHIDFFKEHVDTFPETMCVRYNPGGTFEVANGIMDNPGDAKYGMTPDQTKKAFQKLSEYGVKNIGIHSFLVSGSTSNEYYPKLARTLFELAVELKDLTDLNISFINLSGGVGVAYKPEDTPADIEIIGEGVRKAYEDILVPAGLDNVAIFTELGRWMLAENGGLVAQVLHEKVTYKDYIGLDASAANLLRPAMYGAYHHVSVLGKEDAPADHTYDVTGGLCENNDKFAIDRQLPETTVGDYVWIHDAGAHGAAMGYQYNAKLRSAEVLLREDGSFKQIRRPETPEDYFATMNFDI